MQKSIKIPIGEEYIRGTLIFPKKLMPKNPAFILVHGWASSQLGYVKRANPFVKHGIIVLTINLRGHGNSYGKLENYSRQDHLNDLIAAYNFLISIKEVNENMVGLFGSSYGAYLGAILANKKPLKYLILRAPALYQDKNFNKPTALLIKKDERVYRQQKLTPEDNKALMAVSQFEENLLIIESENDTVCPSATTQNYLQSVNPQAKATHKLIPNAGHVLNQASNNKLMEILGKWLGNNVA